MKLTKREAAERKIDIAVNRINSELEAVKSSFWYFIVPPKFRTAIKLIEGSLAQMQRSEDKLTRL